jgi:hypothetical protein
MLENTTEIALLRAENDRLQALNTEYEADIRLTVANISQLLTDIGVLTEQKTFEFSMPQLTRSITGILIRPATAEERFGYLGSLGNLIKKYSTLVKKG